MNWERRLPPLAKDALDILSAAAEDETRIDGSDAGEKGERTKADFTKEEARAVLEADNEFGEADAAYTLEVLFQRGYIYYVGDNVYITPTDD